VETPASRAAYYAKGAVVDPLSDGIGNLLCILGYCGVA
jgi:hypothetical protein